MPQRGAGFCRQASGADLTEPLGRAAAVGNPHILHVLHCKVAHSCARLACIAAGAAATAFGLKRPGCARVLALEPLRGNHPSAARRPAAVQPNLGCSGPRALMAAAGTAVHGMAACKLPPWYSHHTAALLGLSQAPPPTALHPIPWLNAFHACCMCLNIAPPQHPPRTAVPNDCQLLHPPPSFHEAHVTAVFRRENRENSRLRATMCSMPHKLRRAAAAGPTTPSSSAASGGSSSSVPASSRASGAVCCHLRRLAACIGVSKAQTPLLSTSAELSQGATAASAASAVWFRNLRASRRHCGPRGRCRALCRASCCSNRKHTPVSAAGPAAPAAPGACKLEAGRKPPGAVAAALAACPQPGRRGRRSRRSKASVTSSAKQASWR